MPAFCDTKLTTATGTSAEHRLARPSPVDEIPVGKPHLLTPQADAHAGTRDIFARLNISDAQRQEPEMPVSDAKARPASSQNSLLTAGRD